jgi:hypothetical protein
MMAMTTSSSISVNAGRRCGDDPRMSPTPLGPAESRRPLRAVRYWPGMALHFTGARR